MKKLELTVKAELCFQREDRLRARRTSGLRLFPDLGGRQRGQALQVQDHPVRPTRSSRAGLRIAVLCCRVLFEAAATSQHHAPASGALCPVPKQVSG